MSTSHDASAHAAMRALMSPDPELNQTDRAIYAYLVYRANGARLEGTALVDQFYAELQSMGGRRWDTSSLAARLERRRT